MASSNRGKPKRHALRWSLESAGARGAIAAVNALPERSALALCAATGRALARLDQPYRRLGLANLRLAYPDWSEEQRRALLAESFAERARLTAEWARLPSLSRDEILSRVEFDGLERLEKAFARGRGALAVTAHFGAWELIPVAVRLALPGREITSVGRVMGNRGLQRLIEARRNVGGGEVLDRDPRALVRALRRNAGIGMLVDLRLLSRKGGVLVPFMGLRAWTHPAPALLARRTGAALLPVHARRIEGLRHRIAFGPEIEVARSDDRRSDVIATTARINAAIEEFVRAAPESWIWIQRRWRHSPDVPPDYDGERRRRKRRRR